MESLSTGTLRCSALVSVAVWLAWIYCCSTEPAHTRPVTWHPPSMKLLREVTPRASALLSVLLKRLEVEKRDKEDNFLDLGHAKYLPSWSHHKRYISSCCWSSLRAARLGSRGLWVHVVTPGRGCVVQIICWRCGHLSHLAIFQSSGEKHSLIHLIFGRQLKQAR